MEGYLSAPSHTFYFVVEAADKTSLNNAMEPLGLIGDVKIVPALKYSDALVWARKIGVQKSMDNFNSE